MFNNIERRPDNLGRDLSSFTLADRIDRKYHDLGGSASFLGDPISEIQPCPDGVGKFRHYQGGSIYSHPQAGVHEVHGAIRDRWAALGWEQSYLGYPRTDEQDAPGDTRVSHFQNGSIYWYPLTGTFEVRGAFDASGDPCAALQAELGAIRVQEQLANPSGEPIEPGQGRKPGREPRDPEEIEADRRKSDLVRKLEDCENQPVHLVPLSIRVVKILCDRQNDAGILGIGESDEPYLLVYVLNRPRLLPPDPPRPKVVLIGPIDNVDDDGVERMVPLEQSPPIWGIDQAPLPITDPDQVFIGAVLMENDRSDPSTVREVLEGLMWTKVIPGVLSIGNRDEFTRRLLDGMTGFANIATSDPSIGGLIDRDDRIGTAQELRITRRALHTAYYAGRTELHLFFGDPTAKYRVTFQLAREG